MKKFMKKAIALMAAVLMIFSITACGKSGSEGIVITIWESDQNIEHITKLTDDFLADYKAKYPDAADVSFAFEPYGEGVTIEKLQLYGPTGEGADVLSFIHDKLGVAVQEDLLSENIYSAQYRQEHRADAIAASSIDGKLYGYPITAESQVILYHKDRVTDAQVASIEGLISAGKKLLWKINDGFYSFSMFSDAVLYGEDGDNASLVDFNKPKTVANIETVINHANFSNIKLTDVNNAVTLMRDTTSEGDRIDAVISTPYLYEQLCAAVGKDKVGVAKLPTLNGEELKPYSGYKMYGVNRYSSHPALSHMVAQYLTNARCQEYRMAKMDLLPTINTEEMTAKINLKSIMKTYLSSLELSRVMPNITAMGSKYWSNVENTMTEIMNSKPAYQSDVISTKLATLSNLVKA